MGRMSLFDYFLLQISWFQLIKNNTNVSSVPPPFFPLFSHARIIYSSIQINHYAYNYSKIYKTDYKLT